MAPPAPLASQRPTVARAAWLTAAAALLAGALAAGGGCEKRVVGVRGPGASQHQVQKPFYDAPQWERTLMGDPDPKQRR